MKKFFCVLLAGAVILGEAGSAASVLAAEAGIGTELTAEQETAQGTETGTPESTDDVADEDGTIDEGETGTTETESAADTGTETIEENGTGGKGTESPEAAGGAETGEEEPAEEKAEETGEEEGIESTETAGTEETETAEETEAAEETESTEVIETEETETAEETEAAEETEKAEETEDTEAADFVKKRVTVDREEALKKDTVTPGTSYASALQIGVNTSVTATIKQNLLVTERDHWYKFTITKPGMVSVSFQHEKIDSSINAVAWTVGVDANATGSATVSKNSRANDTLVKTAPLGLAAGTYYIYVSGSALVTSAGDTYLMTLNYEAANCELESNNSLATANNLNIGTTISGSIHGLTDLADYYKVTTTSAGYLYAKFSHDVIAGSETSVVYSIAVLDKDGNELMSKNNTGGETEITTPKLGVPAGTYYIRITGTDYESAYKLKAAFKASSTWEQESNDSYSTANAITSGQKYYGSIQKSGDADYYKIELKKSGYMKVKLTHTDLNNVNQIMSVELYNSDYADVLSMSIMGTEKSVSTSKIGLAAGTYYIVVKDNKKDFFGTYGLTVTTKEVSGWETESNGTASTADSISLGKTMTGVSQTTYDYDWFKFTLSNSAYINFGLTHSKISSDDMAWYVTLMDKNGSRYSLKSTGYIYVYGGTTYTESTPVKLPEGTYYIRVQAGSSAGVGKEYKLAVNKVTTAKPKITSVKSTAYNKLKVSWNRVPGAEKYYIYRSTSKKGGYEKVKTIQNGTTVSWTDSKVTTGKTYYYKIKAVVKLDKSKATSASAAKSGKAVPAAATLKAAASSKKVKLTWSKVTGASGYVIYRSTSKKGTYKKIKTVTKGSTKTYTNSNLTKGKTYYYKIRAYRTVNGKKVYGSYSAVVSAKVK